MSNPILDILTAEILATQDIEAAATIALSAIRTPGPVISVINVSTVVTDAEVAKASAAIQTQVVLDFLPAWGLSARLVFVPNGGKPAPGIWQMIILDNSDQAGALGYHDLTTEGLPLGKVFAKSNLDAGMAWTTAFSHEVLEMIVDPWINYTVFVDIPRGGRLYALEVADAPEDDQFGYLIDGVLVSDFVFPSWFEPNFPGKPQFDQMNKITAPLQLLPGGYIGVYDVSGGGGWQQLSAELPCAKARGPIGSRRERRRTPRDQWLRSTR